MADFTRADAPGYSILYPETEEAQEWVDENVDASDVLDASGGVIASDEMVEAIQQAGLDIEDEEYEPA